MITRTWFALLLCALPAAPALAEEAAAAPPVKEAAAGPSVKQAASYAFGVDMGRRFKQEGVEVDAEQLVRGLKDGLAGAPLTMTERDFKRALAIFQGEMRVKSEKTRRRTFVVNQEEGKAFLEANRKKEGVVTLPSGLQYKVLQAGHGKRPTASDTVLVNYRGTLIDGTEFEASPAGKPSSLKLAGLIAGWREALPLMAEGSRWQLFVPPQLGYGERGNTAGVGPNATLLFELELVGVR